MGRKRYQFQLYVLNKVFSGRKEGWKEEKKERRKEGRKKKK
jgi:hypothetical protein